MKNIPNITALRFLLALLVVCFHLPQFCEKHGIPYIKNFENIPFFDRGTEAVYLFFSLSGFLIIRQLYLEKITTNTISLSAFFIRRMLRIFPLYYLVLIFGLFYYQLILPSMGFDFQNNYNLLNGILLAVFFMPNIFAELYQPGGIIEVLWSIGIEEQFYLFVAPLLWILPIKWIKTFLFLFTSVYFFAFFSGFFESLNQFGMYFFYFSLSGLFSIISLTNNHLFNYKLFIYLTYTLMIFYFFTPLLKNHLNESSYHLLSLILFSNFICILSQKPISFLSHNVTIYLGKISYGIYMYHTIVIQLIGFIYLKKIAIFRLSEVSIIALYYTSTIVVTILVAHFSYQYFESFFLTLKKGFRTKQLTFK